VPAVKPLKERNQAVVGAVALVVLALAAFGAFRAEDLPLFGGGTHYTAQFAESAGLNVDDEVRMAGIKVGKVTSVGLSRGLVVVGFRAKGVRVGDQSRVSIEIKTLLGEKYLAVESAGAEAQDPDRPIPVDRTRTPFEVPEAFNQLTNSVNQIDTAQLAQSFRTLSETFAHTPDQVSGTLTGLSRLSETIASRDAELSGLLVSAANVTGVVAQRNDQVSRLITDGSTLLDELSRRRDAIDELLDGTERLSDQLRGAVRDNDDQLHPALAELADTTKMLERNKDALEHGIQSATNYARIFSGAVGSGRWFDGYFCGLFNPTFVAGGMTFNPGTCAPPKPLPGSPSLPGSLPVPGGHR
jgi:phospholipid/cholesterol/gamma-HCH transport system substrate-binding protein